MTSADEPSSFGWAPMTERELYAAAGMSHFLDAAEAGDPMAILLKQRLDAAHEAMRPKLAAMAEEMWLNPSPGSGGLADLIADLKD